MSENELVKVEDLDNLPASKYSDEDWDAAASGGGYTPRLQLMTSNSKKCKSGEFPINHYALISDQKYDDLGKNIDVFIFAWRPKALETGENVISVYDPNSEDFARIQSRSVNESNSGCMFGPEFLVWVPSAGKFATFFCGTASSRREAGNLKALLKKPATLGSQFCKNKSFEWYAPECSTCSTPFDMPSKQDLLEAIEKFNNPPKSDIEGVAEEEETRAR